MRVLLDSVNGEACSLLDSAKDGGANDTLAVNKVSLHGVSLGVADAD